MKKQKKEMQVVFAEGKFIRAVGIDPGLVDTGVVALSINLFAAEATVSYHVIEKAKRMKVSELNRTLNELPLVKVGWPVFIEKYQPRRGFSTDVSMVELTKNIADAVPGPHMMVSNTGFKKIVTRDWMELFWASKLPKSNHDDLNSALRILLLGLFKNETANERLAELVYVHQRSLKVNVERLVR